MFLPVPGGWNAVGNAVGVNGMPQDAYQAELARCLADHVRRVRGEVERVQAAAKSPDGLIRATVAGHGEVLELDLNPRALRDTDSRALADDITRTIQNAQQAADREISRLSKQIPPPLPGQVS
jgi:DNA-binding protein YbaB